MGEENNVVAKNYLETNLKEINYNKGKAEICKKCMSLLDYQNITWVLINKDGNNTQKKNDNRYWRQINYVRFY